MLALRVLLTRAENLQKVADQDSTEEAAIAAASGCYYLLSSWSALFYFVALRVVQGYYGEYALRKAISGPGAQSMTMSTVGL